MNYPVDLQSHWKPSWTEPGARNGTDPNIRLLYVHTYFYQAYKSTMHINKIINLKAYEYICCVSALTNAELMLVHANNTAAEHSTIALLEIIHLGLRLIWFCCGICTECILWCVRECFNFQHVCVLVATTSFIALLHCSAISIALNANNGKWNRYRAKPNAIIFVEFSRAPHTFRHKARAIIHIAWPAGRA